MRAAGTLACCAGTVLVAVALTACGSSGDKGTPPTTSASSSASKSHSSSPAPSRTAPKLATKLPGTCDSLLPQPEVEELMGVQFFGKSAYVVGIPEKNIGRLAYINCRYGLGPTGKGTPAVEVGVSLYKSAAQAQQRLAGTIQDYTDHGATRSTAEVAGHSGAMLTGGPAPNYNIPTLVIASDQRTVAVSVVTTVLPSAKRGPAMVKLAGLALDRTAP